jgi:hypothetical protein
MVRTLAAARLSSDRRRISVLSSIALVASAVLATACSGGGADDEAGDSTAASVSSATQETDPPEPLTSIVEIGSAEHVDGDVEYAQSPPIGGDHNPAWMNCGVYAEEVMEEAAVHSLEHGAVWLTYRPDLVDEATIAALVAVSAAESKVLVSPYAAQEAAIVASAWGAQMSFEQADDPDLARFVSTFQGAASSPEPNAPCEGALGDPE